jgi:hypothetical protein
MTMVFVACAAGSTAAQEAVPPCRDADYALPPPPDDPARHRQFDLSPLVYVEGGRTPRVYGVNIDVVVDEGGRVTCSSPGSLDGIDTPQRAALFKQTAAWRYRPFAIDGKPARVWIREEVAEEVRPAKHAGMPIAPLSRMKITLTSAGHTAVLRGDGTAKFDDGESYTIGVGAFAALIERLRGADMWSLKSDYVVSLPDAGWPASIVADIDGQKKAIAFLNPDKAGMPQTMQLAIGEVRRIARFDEWEAVVITPRRGLKGPRIYRRRTSPETTDFEVQPPAPVK